MGGIDLDHMKNQINFVLYHANKLLNQELNSMAIVMQEYKSPHSIFVNLFYLQLW